MDDKPIFKPIRKATPQKLDHVRIQTICNQSNLPLYLITRCGLYSLQSWWSSS